MSRAIRFSDDAGFSWSVCEVPARRVGRKSVAGDAAVAERLGPRERVKRGLYFFSRYTTKRLAEYPPEWTRLSPTALMQLCASAESLRDVTLITGEHAVSIEMAAEPEVRNRPARRDERLTSRAPDRGNRLDRPAL